MNRLVTPLGIGKRHCTEKKGMKLAMEKGKYVGKKQMKQKKKAKMYTRLEKVRLGTDC